jgi:hypothetical protein
MAANPPCFFNPQSAIRNQVIYLCPSPCHNLTRRINFSSPQNLSANIQSKELPL